MLDRIVSLILLIIISPLLLIIAILIRLDSPGPALFRQQRLGCSGRVFTILKLRTMQINSEQKYNADGSTVVSKQDSRLTRLGKVLRVGLDEFPQLINILKGEMSFVGPRPDPIFSLDMYSDHHKNRLALRPGITGLAQVTGRTKITVTTRWDYDLKYIESYSLLLDVKIIFNTFITLFKSALEVK